MSLSVDITHRFAAFDLSVQFETPGGLTALIGRSGAGKTTVANVVAGLLRPDSARVSVDANILADTDRGVWVSPQARRIGYVFQEARLFPHMSVRANLLYGARRRGHQVRAKADLPHVLDLLDIAPLLDRRPGALSGGERQRVAIGRALLSDPQMLLLDEPLAALDPARKAEILPYLERLRDDADMPILYVSHAMEEVARLANSVVVLEAGQVLASGPAAEVLSDPAAIPMMDPAAAGAILEARLAGHDDDGLSRLSVSGGSLFLPHIDGVPGDRLRLRIEAQDVMLSRTRPVDISALNIVQGKVMSVYPGKGPGALVRIRTGEDVILARVTQRSVAALGLAPGEDVFAIIKSLAVTSGNIGRAHR